MGPTFALAQPGHRVGVRRVARQLESAQPLDRQNLARQQAFLRFLERLLARLGDHIPLRRFQPEMRAADGTGVRLGVESPVGGIFVLGAAGVAEREDAHRGLGAVVGDVLDDGEARAAVGAVDEGVAIAAVGGIEQLAAAILAGRHIGRDELVAPGLRLGVADLEALVAWVCKGNLARTQRLDARQRRRFLL